MDEEKRYKLLFYYSFISLVFCIKNPSLEQLQSKYTSHVRKY